MTTNPFRKTFYKGITLVLLHLLLLPSAFAIKITVPKQYEDQVEAIKKAEAAERARQMEAVAEGDSTESENQGTSGTDSAQGSNASDQTTNGKAPAEDFLVQSLAEANNIATSLEEGVPANMGFISGQIVDKESGQPLPGVAILLEGTDFGTVTDNAGRYTLGPAPAGNYTINFVKSGYIEANVTDYAIVAGEVSVFPFALPPRPAEMSDDVYVLQDFTVSAEEANEMMLQLDLQKMSLTQLDIMGSEDFSKFAASDIADAVKSITGVSLSDGKYAVVRGLNDRYSVTQLNGITLPSPDPDRAAVPLDAFPTGIFGSIETRKTNSPDLPGEASGGVIDLKVLSFPEERILKFSAGTGFNSNSKDDWINTSRNGKDDYYASGAKNRDFSSIPLGQGGPVPLFSSPGVVNTAGIGAADQEASAEANADFLPRRSSGADDLDFSGSFLYGETFDLGDKSRYSLLLAGSQSWKSRYRELEINKVKDVEASNAQGILGSGNYLVNEFPGSVPDRDGDGLPDRVGYRENGSFEALISTVAGISYEFDERLAFGYRFIFTRSGNEDNIINVAGKQWQDGGFGSTQDFEALNGDASQLTNTGEDYLVSQYTQRTLYAHQFEGSADMTEELGIIVDAALLDTRNEQIEPDTFDSRGGTVDEVRFNRTTTQDSRGFVTNVSVPLEESYDFFSFGRGHTFKLGLSDESSTREFLQLQQNSIGSTSIDPALNYTVSRTFVPAPAPVGFDPGVTGQADGSRDIFGRYLMMDSRPNEWLQVVAGVRWEDSEISYEGFGSAPQAGNFSPELLTGSPIDQTDMIPSFNINIDLPRDIKLRFAYSETIARPTYRELQPFPILNLLTNEIEVGNPGAMAQLSGGAPPVYVLADTNGNPLTQYQGLEIANVKNYDARIEWYPTDDSMFAVGVFYKKVGNPIERVEVFGQDSELPVFTFVNNENTADLLGVELEMRQNVGSFLDRESLEFLSVGGNFTYISAQVDRSEAELTTAELAGFPRDGFSEDRPLYDQPDMIGNFFVNLNFDKIGADFTVSANYVGERLNAAAGSSSSDIFEEPVTTLNFVYQQKILAVEGLSLKFVAKNFTDPTFSRTTKRGDNAAGLYGPSGEPVEEVDLESYKKGVDYSISISYEF